MQIWEAFLLSVTAVSGILVFLSFKDKAYRPIGEFFNAKFVEPYNELHARCNEYEKTQEILIAGQLALLHDRVYQACKHYINAGCIDVDDLKNLEHLFEAYVAMGGNGTCKQLYNRVCGLKFKKD